MKAVVTSQYILTNTNSWHYSDESNSYFTMCTHQLQQLTLLLWKQLLLHNVYSPTPAADITPMTAVVTSQCVLTNSSSWHYSYVSTYCEVTIAFIGVMSAAGVGEYTLWSNYCFHRSNVSCWRWWVHICVLTNSSSGHYSDESSCYFTMCTHRLQQLTLLLWKQ
jgi:hypothetical protein